MNEFGNMNEERNELISRQNIARTKGDHKTVKMISQKLRKLTTRMHKLQNK